MDRINPDANYGIGEAALLANRDRGTIRRYVSQRPDIFPTIFDPMTHRRLIPGTIVIKIRDKQY